MPRDPIRGRPKHYVAIDDVGWFDTSQNPTKEMPMYDPTAVPTAGYEPNTSNASDVVANLDPTQLKELETRTTPTEEPAEPKTAPKREPNRHERRAMGVKDRRMAKKFDVLMKRHEKKARIQAAKTPPAVSTQLPAPGMTDLMVPPETITTESVADLPVEDSTTPTKE